MTAVLQFLKGGYRKSPEMVTLESFTCISFVPTRLYILHLSRRPRRLQTSAAEEFLTELGQGLAMISNPAISLYQLNGKSQFVTSTNEFQLYKLAAAVSQVHPHGSWTKIFESYPSEESPILPLAALVWTDGSSDQQVPSGVMGSVVETDKRKSSKHLLQTVRFSLTSVCLARAIESMLRHFSIMESRNSTTGEIDTQSSTCLLIAANEYIPTCIGSTDTTMVSEHVLLVTEILLASLC